MPERKRRPRSGRVRGGTLDLIDGVLIGVVLLVVAALGAYALFTQQSRALVAAQAARPVSAASVSPSPTSTPVPVIDVIAASASDAGTFASGISAATHATVHTIAGNGFTAAQRGYPALAAGVDATAAVVVVIPSASDRAAGLIDLQAHVSTTVAVIAKRAPDARVILVGPVVSSTQGAALAAMRTGMKALAKTLTVTYTDPTDHGWVGTRVDTTGVVTAAGLESVANGLGAQAETLL